MQGSNLRDLDLTPPSVGYIVLLMSSMFSDGPRPPEPYREIGRLGGCLWLFVAGCFYLFVAGAVGVGIDLGPAVLALIVPPVGLASVVFVGGRSPIVLGLSALAALGYAGLGVLNYLSAARFELLNPGAVDVSGHGASIIFILLMLATASWSLVAAALRLR